MATEAERHSDDDISFDDWHFVTKSTNNGDFSDDDSIEIIEREVLHSVTPSSSEDESETETVDGETHEEITPETTPEEIPPEIPAYQITSLNENSQVSSLNNSTNVDSLVTSVNTNSEVSSPENSTVKKAKCKGRRKKLQNSDRDLDFYEIFAITLLSTFVLGVVFFEISRHVERMNNPTEVNKASSTSSSDGNAPSPIVNSSPSSSEYINSTNKDVDHSNLGPMDNLKEILDEKKLMVDNIFIKYFALYQYTYYLKNDTYALNVTQLRRDKMQYYTPLLYEKLFSHFKNWENEATECDEIDNIISAKLPIICRQDSYVVIFLKKHHYLSMFENIINVLQIETTKIMDLDDNIVKTLSKNQPLNQIDSVDEKIQDFDDSIRVQKHKVQVETLNEKPTVISDVENQKKISIQEKVITIEENLLKRELPLKLLSNEFESSYENDANSKTPENNDSEVKLEKLIEEIKIILRKFERQWQNFYKFQILQTWRDTKCKHDLCAPQDEVHDAEKIQSDVFPSEADKVNTTYGEKDDSISGFIYDTVPITDRWSLKMNAEKSKNANYYDKLTGEWILKLGKAREKFRRKYKEKVDKKRPEKSKDKSENEDDKFYKPYRAWIKQTREKMKTDYKKFTSHMKSKFKKLGEGVKRNYEKFVSSDWKHYAKSIFQRFRL